MSKLLMIIVAVVAVLVIPGRLSGKEKGNKRQT